MQVATYALSVGRKVVAREVFAAVGPRRIGTHVEPDGRSIRRALEWLLPFWTGEKAWEYDRIAPFERASVFPSLYRAWHVSGDERYRHTITQLADNDAALTCAPVHQWMGGCCPAEP